MTEKMIRKPLPKDPTAHHTHLNTHLIQDIDRLTEEVAFLKFSLNELNLSQDQQTSLKETYVAMGKELPKGYE